jgi:hypothetical protein
MIVLLLHYDVYIACAVTSNSTAGLYGDLSEVACASTDLSVPLLRPAQTGAGRGRMGFRLGHLLYLVLPSPYPFSECRNSQWKWLLDLGGGRRRWFLGEEPPICNATAPLNCNMPTRTAIEKLKLGYIIMPIAVTLLLLSACKNSHWKWIYLRWWLLQ